MERLQGLDRFQFLRSLWGACFLAIFAWLFAIPAQAHHPWDGQPETFSLFQGLLSGLVHPILGLDHLLFLLSIGLVAGSREFRWVPFLLCFGLLGSAFAQVAPPLIFAEGVMGLSLIASACVALGRIRPVWMIPLIASHGYVLGQAMVGAEPTPLAAYFLGLLVSETLVIFIGIKLLRTSIKHRGLFSGALIGSVLAFT